jgi:RNA polymerase sigma factor (sigma-70 family)
MDATGRVGPDNALVLAARDGDPRALDALVAQSLPLVYNIVGRALGGHADVDDVVQETLLRMVRHLPDLRDPDAFRSWLVAITVRQMRDREQQRSADLRRSTALDDDRDALPAGADFAELTILKLGLSDQRREVAEATRWLERDDRELLALWWLEEAGALGRSDLAHALELSHQHAAVKINRMKEQMSTARAVVRALRAEPRCPELGAVVHGWDGVPSPLWRKRLARHIRECALCDRRTFGLLPMERLLAGAALVPVPASLAARILGGPHATAPSGPASTSQASTSQSTGGQAAAGQAPGGQAPGGQAAGGQPPGGQPPGGQAPGGQAPGGGAGIGGGHAVAVKAGAGGLLGGWTGAVGAAAVVAAVIATVVVVLTVNQAKPDPANAGGPVPSHSSMVASPSASPNPSPSALSPSPSRSAKPAIPAVPATSSRKGVGVWSFSGVNQALVDSGAQWYYTWATSHSGVSTPKGVDFVPMIWGSGSVTSSALAQAKSAGSRYLLGFNEPDMAGQANMSVDAALQLWPQLVATGLTLGSPAVAYGADTPGGWLDRFMTGAASKGYRVDFITLHWYGGDFTTANAVNQLRSYVEKVYNRYHKPIWLTEYALIDFSGGGTRFPTQAQQASFCTASIVMLDSLSYLQRYAWFGLPADDAKDSSGLYHSGPTPTDVGKAFAAAH